MYNFDNMIHLAVNNKFCFFLSLLAKIKCNIRSYQFNNNKFHFIAGASVTSMLSQECTHVLVDQNMLVDMDLVNAIVAKKPLVQTSWLEVVKYYYPVLFFFGL